MNKDELMVWLWERHVEFPPYATVQHLRILYEQEMIRKRLNELVLNEEEERQSYDGEATEENNDDDEWEKEEARLNAELRVLTKRKLVADLRREIAAIEQNANVVPVKQPDFMDIKYAVPCFSGSEAYDANKWLLDFERACDSVRGNDDFRLRCIRRLMEPGSEAEIFFVWIDRQLTRRSRLVSWKISATYIQFRRSSIN